MSELNPCQYRYRITLQGSVSTRDPQGNAANTWQNNITVWAAFHPLKGREYLQAAAMQYESLVRFHIRYRKGITTDMRILYDNRIFEIQAVIDVDGRHRELQLMAKGAHV